MGIKGKGWFFGLDPSLENPSKCRGYALESVVVDQGRFKGIGCYRKRYLFPRKSGNRWR